MDVVPVDLLAYFTPDDLARGARRFHASVATGALDLALDVALLLAASFSPPARRLWDRLLARSQARPGTLSRLTGPEGPAGALFLALVALAREVALFPTLLWRDWHVARALGVSHEPLPSFLRHAATDAAFAIAALAVLGLGLGAVRRRWPRRWWLAVGAVAALALVGDALVEPLRAHLHYDVRPLPDGPLRARLERLLTEQGSPRADLLVIDASRVGTRVNAFVSGLGPTRRIVVTDTLLAMGDEAVAGAVAHEIGHRRPERLPGRLALAGLALVGFLGLVELLVRIARRRGAPSDAAAVPFVVAAITLAGLLIMPARAAFARAEERDADRLELSMRADTDAYISDVVRQARAGALLPRPPAWFVFWMADHPSSEERIGRALWYRSRRSGGFPAGGAP